MGLKGFYKRHENQILATALVLALVLFLGVRYDYYYDLNDDVTMKDLLSGVYTGEPEGHNIQMLYPLSLVISLGYRIFPKAPVYGMFLCLCQYGCIWLAVERSLRFARGTGHKIGMAFAQGVVLFALLLSHLIFVQYTFVSAMLAGTAAFLFLTSEEARGRDFVQKNIPAILLALLAYLLRTEMLLLLLPLICVAGMYRWSLEQEIFTRDNAVKYLAVFGGLLFGMAVSFGVNQAAFGSAEWKAYVEFFNSRTELYDFRGIPPYEGNEELYAGLGLTEYEQALLLEEYNFGLEDGLDAEDLDRISDYQAAAQKGERPFFALLKEKLKGYVYRSVHRGAEGTAVLVDYPWNYLVMAWYGLVCLAMLLNGMAAGKRGKEGSGHWGFAAGIGKLAFLYCVRTALWMFILIRGREPVRIIHSLYWMERCILAAMFFMELDRMRRERKGVLPVFAQGKGPEGFAPWKKEALGGLLLLVTVLAGTVEAGRSLAAADKECQARAVADIVDKGMKGYCREHPGNFYFFDVYSAVSYPLEPYQGTPYAEKMFAEVDNRYGNYDIMGGWLVKSPSYRKKLQAFGIGSMRDALLYQDNVYMMAELRKGTEGFEDYFKELGIEVEVELVDMAGDLIGVYKIEGIGKGI